MREAGIIATDSPNQKLSDIFLQLHISERSGRGVPLITKVYGQEAFEFRENPIVVTIPFTVFSTKDGGKVGDKVGDKSIVRLNPTRQRIVEEMRNNPNVTLCLCDLPALRAFTKKTQTCHISATFLTQIGQTGNLYYPQHQKKPCTMLQNPIRHLRLAALIFDICDLFREGAVDPMPLVRDRVLQFRKARGYL